MNVRPNPLMRRANPIEIKGHLVLMEERM